MGPLVAGDDVQAQRPGAIRPDPQRGGGVDGVRHPNSQYQAEATGVLVFEPLTVPGLLQTEDYARAVIRDGTSKLSEERIQARIDLRMRRQQALYDDPPLEVIAVIDESVLHRVVGGREVMRAQFERLQKVAQLPNVTVQLVPFDAGAHAGMSGSFNNAPRSVRRLVEKKHQKPERLLVRRSHSVDRAFQQVGPALPASSRQEGIFPAEGTVPRRAWPPVATRGRSPSSEDR
ncbi:DUF5753 domain-containing protein [Actinoallomurus acanthiterrae]